MTDREIRWLRHGQPLPDGWEILPQRMDTHHNAYAVLIGRTLSALSDTSPLQGVALPRTMPEITAQRADQ